MGSKSKEKPKNSLRVENEPKVKKVKSSNGSPKKRSFNLKLDWIKDERFARVFGLILLGFSFYLLIAFVSYFINWFRFTSDDIFTNISFSRVLFDQTLVVNNWTGRLGAAFSTLFIKNWFGLSSVYFLLLFFNLGLKWLTGITLIRLRYFFTHGVFLVLWLSISLGYFFQTGRISILGGVVGFELSQWFNGLLGKSGTFILVLISLLSYLIIGFNVHFLLRSLFSSKTDEIADEETGLSYSELESLMADDEDSVEKIADSMEMEITNESAIEEESYPDLEDAFHEIKLDTSVSETDTIDENDGFAVEIAEGDGQVEPDSEKPDSDEIVHHTIDTEYDPLEDLRDFKTPDLEFLNDHGSSNEISINKEELEANKNKIVKTLSDYSIAIDKIKATIGPTITLYEIVPAPGIRISKIRNLEDDIALSLSALGIRIIAPIPGRGTIGIEVPNQKPEIVSMKTVLSSEKFQTFKGELPVAIGKTISNETFVFDLTKMPHLLMAGATGQGKSVGLNAVITSLLYKKHPAQVKFVMVDPKKVELSLYSKIERHYLAKLPEKAEAIITDVHDVVTTLNSLCMEMDHRYDLLKDAQVRTIKEYNVKFVQRQLNPQNGHRYLPYIVLIVDEFADLIMTAGKEVEGPIARLAQLARAIGIHLIIATQRPSVNIITGVIKANFPARIAFRVTSKIDSRTILDTGGADQLIGRGDMLFSTGGNLIRIQCAFVDTPEIEEIVDYIGNQRGYSSAMELPEYIDENSPQKDLDMDDRDEMFEEAARLIVQHQQGSTSLIQRKLKLGYNRAGRIIDQLEAAGIVGPFEGSKAREVRISDLNYLEQFLKNLNDN
ncbi:MAG: DNA translocase FtsK 4TM domain-containing protein [Bacteroidales bacterium]|nr:DNA translocase FtsK 4TM domain-containing protein [Bacteroidales bacterium]